MVTRTKYNVYRLTGPSRVVVRESATKPEGYGLGHGHFGDSGGNSLHPESPTPSVRNRGLKRERETEGRREVSSPLTHSTESPS